MKSFFVFDVESVGLHGEGFAVGGGVYLENGAIRWGFSCACPMEEAKASDNDAVIWCKDNIPVIAITHRTPKAVRSEFWNNWLKAKSQGAIMAADCLWPVEAGFVARAIYDDIDNRSKDGPYPFIDIASVLMSAGMDPIGMYDRTESEQPKHNPYSDAMQSARMLALALSRIGDMEYPHSSFRTTD
jgi:hypothetical protein